MAQLLLPYEKMSQDAPHSRAPEHFTGRPLSVCQISHLLTCKFRTTKSRGVATPCPLGPGGTASPAGGTCDREPCELNDDRGTGELLWPLGGRSLKVYCWPCLVDFLGIEKIAFAR